MANELYHYGRKGMKWYQHIFTNGEGLYKNRRAEDYQKYVVKNEVKKAAVNKKIRDIQDSLSDEYKKGDKADKKTIEKLTKELSSAESDLDKLNTDPDKQIRTADAARKKSMFTTSSSVTNGAKNAASEVFALRKAVKGADTKDLTNDDLRRLTERLNLETNYANAVSRKTDKAEAWVTGILGVAGNLFSTGASAVELYSAMMEASGAKYKITGDYTTD